MAVYKENFIDVKLEGGNIPRSFFNCQVGEGDGYADRIGARLFMDGEPEAITGACIGYFIRPDGISLVIGGTVSGNTAYVDLPPAAYAREGTFSLAIKVSDQTGYYKTVRIVDGSVVNTTTGEIYDPASAIPSPAQYAQDVAAAEAAAATIASYAINAVQITGTRYKFVTRPT